MKPPKFRYFAPKSVGEALTLLEEHAVEARVLAGGQSLVPLMNMRLVHPDVLIDINGISELSFIEATNGGLAIGALTRDATLTGDMRIAESLSVLSEAAHFVGHPAIRNRSTVGGSLAHADPAAELPAVMLALDAEFIVRSSSGARRVTADDFFVGLFTTDVRPGELLTEVVVPSRAERTGFAFQE